MTLATMAMKSGNLSLLKPSGPFQTCTGIALPPWKVITSLEANATERKEFEPIQVGLIKISGKMYA